MYFSLFQSAKSTTPTKEIDLQTLYIWTREGTYKDAIAKARYYYNQDNEAYQQAKLEIPAVSISGTFKIRRIADIINHSGYICIDFDAKDNFTSQQDVDDIFNILKSDVHTTFLARSISNNGLMAVVKINPTPTNEHQHTVAKQLEEYYQDTYGLFPDPSCKDISRLRFISYDPNAYFYPESKTWSSNGIIKVQPKSVTNAKNKFNNKIYVKNDVHDLINKIIDSGVNLTESYSEWLSIGFAIESEFGASGENYFLKLSQASSKYDPVKARKQWDAILRHKNTGKDVTIGTLIYYAKREGVEFISKKNDKLINATIGWKKQGIQISNIPTTALKIYGDAYSTETITEIAQKVYSSDNIAPPEGVSSVESIETFLKSNYDFRYNSVTSIPEIKINDLWQICDERFENFLWMESCKNVNNGISKNQITQTINSYGFMQEVNPIKEEFEELQQKYDYKDCIGTISKLCDIIQNSTDFETQKRYHLDSGLPYIHYFFTKWLVCVIGQLYGNVNPHVIVLTGSGQGTNKTDLWRNILPKQLEEYVGQTSFTENKDLYEQLEKYLILINDEWAGKNAQQVNFLKMLFSQNTISMRKSYGRHVKNYNRTASICATSNVEKLLNDPTGNRRIIPIKIERMMERDQLRAIDKEKLWAEAMHLYNKHPQASYEFDPYLNPADVIFLNESTEQFKVESLEEDTLEVSGFRPYTDESTLPLIHLTGSIMRTVIETAMKVRLEHTAFSMALKNAGFNQTKMMKINKKAGRYYEVELTEKLKSNLNLIGYDFSA